MTTALILAGGLGTRLRDVLPDRPKPLALVAERPFIFYLLDQLDSAAISEVVLCTGFGHEIMEKEVGTSYKNMEIKYSREDTPLGTGGALRKALSHTSADQLIAMNGDSYAGVDLQEYINWHSTGEAEGSLLLTWKDDTSRYGQVSIDDQDRVTRFQEKDENQHEGWINAGVYLFSRTLMESIASTGPVSLEKECLPNWVSIGLRGFRAHSPFIDIGTPESLKAADQFFAQQ